MLAVLQFRPPWFRHWKILHWSLVTNVLVIQNSMLSYSVLWRRWRILTGSLMLWWSAIAKLHLESSLDVHVVVGLPRLETMEGVWWGKSHLCHHWVGISLTIVTADNHTDTKLILPSINFLCTDLFKDIQRLITLDNTYLNQIKQALDWNFHCLVDELQATSKSEFLIKKGDELHVS